MIFYSSSLSTEFLLGFLMIFIHSIFFFRSPFDRLEKYIEFRSDIVGITLELSRSVCIPRKQLLFNFRQIKEVLLILFCSKY